MGTKRQRDSNEDDINKESQRAESKQQKKMDHYLTKKDSTQINREKSQVNSHDSGEETAEAKEENSKYDIPTPDVKKSDKSEKEKSENEIKSEHKQALDTESTETPSKRMKMDKDSTVKDKNLITNDGEYVPKDKHRTNEESRNTSTDDFSVSHKEPSKKPKKNKKDKKSKHSHKHSHNHSHKHRSESDKKSKHSGSHKERKSHKDSNEHENDPNQQRLDKEKKSKHSHTDSSESEENSPCSRRDSEKKAKDSHTDRIPENNATYPQRDSEIHSERSHRSFYSSDSETSPSKERCSHRDIPEKTSNRSDKKREKECGFTSRERKVSGGTPKHSSKYSKNDEYVPSSKCHEDRSKHSRSSYSGIECSSKDKSKSKEDKVIVQSRKRHSGHLDTSPSIDKSYPREKNAQQSLRFESTPEKPELHLEKGKPKSPKKSERKFEETTDSSNTDLKEKHRNNINILIESMKEENRIKNSAERIGHLVLTNKLITTRDDFVFFFGMVSPFSQFHAANFKVQNITYRCAEQYMMHQKAVLFDDKQIAKQIMEETKPLKMKRLGRKVRNFDAEKWGNKCREVVKDGNIAKFSQNYHLEQSLFATHPKIMAEASPRDCLWGIGLGASNAKAWNVRSWRGKNLLGYTLMDVRGILMRAKGLIK